jgi:hypothetical protein
MKATAQARYDDNALIKLAAQVACGRVGPVNFENQQRDYDREGRIAETFEATWLREKGRPLLVCGRRQRAVVVNTHMKFL